MNHPDQPALTKIQGSIEAHGQTTPIEIEVFPGVYRFTYQNTAWEVLYLNCLYDLTQDDDGQLSCLLTFPFQFPARFVGQLVFRECLITIKTDEHGFFDTLRFRKEDIDSGERQWTFEDDYQQMYQSVFQDGTPESCITCRWAVDNPYGPGQGLRCMVHLKDQPLVLHGLQKRYKGGDRLGVFDASPMVRENFWCDQHQQAREPFRPNCNP